MPMRITKDLEVTKLACAGFLLPEIVCNLHINVFEVMKCMNIFKAHECTSIYHLFPRRTLLIYPSPSKDESASTFSLTTIMYSHRIFKFDR